VKKNLLKNCSKSYRGIMNSRTMAEDTISGNPTGESNIGVGSQGDYVDLHELSKGWKAAIARAKDPATR
jgi:hypothetical protein